MLFQNTVAKLYVFMKCHKIQSNYFNTYQHSHWLFLVCMFNIYGEILDYITLCIRGYSMRSLSYHFGSQKCNSF